MPSIREYLSGDHARLDTLLQYAITGDLPSYDAFRRGLLRHIAIEERVLFPELRKRGEESDLVRQLHRDHAALSALLVPPPTTWELTTIRTLLDQHNPLEEGPDGLYAQLDSTEAAEQAALLQRIENWPQIRTAPNVDNPTVRRSIAQLLAEAEEGRKSLR